MRSLLSLTLALWLAVGLAACDATDISVDALASVETAASDNAATVGCNTSGSDTGDTLVEVNGVLMAVSGPLTQFGCVLNEQTGVAQGTVLLPDEAVPSKAQVLRGEDLGFQCSQTFDGENVFTTDFRIVNTPGGTSKIVCNFRL